MSTIFDVYIQGGPAYMHPITLLLLFNLFLVGYTVFNRSRNRVIAPGWVEAIKQVGGLAVAFGTFGTLAGLFMAFNALENSEHVIPFQVIMGGLKVSLINVLYGLIVFFISMIAYLILKLTQVNGAT